MVATDLEPAARASAAPARHPRRRGHGRFAYRVARVLMPLAVAGVFLLVWDAVALTAFAGKGYLLPDPASVAAAMKENIGLLLRATWDTFIESAEGFVAGGAVGFQTVPVIAVAPILILLLHYGRPAIIAIVVLVTFFPILSNTLGGLRDTNPHHAELFRLYRASHLHVLWKLKFPQALPATFAGFRIAAGLAVVGATVGEFLIGETGGRPGLGVLLVTTQQELKTPLLFGAAGFATALAVLFFLVVNWVARLVLHRWTAA